MPARSLAPTLIALLFVAAGLVVAAGLAPAGAMAARHPARHTARHTGKADQATLRDNRKCKGTGIYPNPSNLSKVEAATLCLINMARDAKGRRPLRFNADLHAVAAGQASEMVLGDYFGDDNRAGQTPLQRIVASSYPEHAARVSTAQNIGWGTGPYASPAGMVRAWMLSPPHRRIILTAGYRDIGIGVAPAAPSSVASGIRGATYTVEFGRRKPASGSATSKSATAAADPASAAMTSKSDPASAATTGHASPAGPIL
jgi:uncharacterized protein YkwD